jgi:hypothetical protein
MIILGSLALWLYHSRPHNSRYHDLCTTLKVPTNIKSLLGLGLNFIPRPRYSTESNDLEITRFIRDAYTKFFFSGETNSTIPKLFIRTNWCPKLFEINASFRERIDKFARCLQLQFKRKKSCINLLPHQHMALHYLRHQKEFIILKSDKNLGPCVLERDKYIQRAYSEHLSDTTTYLQLSSAEADLRCQAITSKIERFMVNHFKKRENNDDRKYLQRYMEGVTDPYSYFYLLAKVHKIPWRTRPIVSTVGSVAYGLARWVDIQLKEIIKLLPYTVSSSYELSKKLRAINVPSTASLYTSDAVSMYTNIDTNHAIRQICEFVLTTDYGRRAGIDTFALIQGLELVMYNNIFKFGDTFWLQLTGTAMGTPPAPNYATLYFAIHEIKVLSKYPELLFYCRYLDDCLGIWSGTVLRYQQFQVEFGNYGKLTWEFTELSCTINFLDLDISLQENGTITTSLYEKALNLYLYLPPHSAHAPGVLRGLVSGMLLRIKRLTSNPEAVHPCVKLFYRRLLQRGYNSSVILPLFQKYFRTRVPRIKDSSGTLFLHVKYHPLDPPSQLIQSHFRELIRDRPGDLPLSELLNRHQEPCKIDRMIIAYSRNKNVSELVSPRKLHTADGVPVSTTLRGDEVEDAVNPNPN